MRNEFHIVTRWQVPAPAKRVAELLTEAERFPDWWGAVYLGIEVLDPGGPGQVGRRIKVHSKGWLPYHIHWTGTLTESEFPHRWRIRAEGDLVGEGEWRLTERDGITEAVYDWRITADRPLFRLLSPLLGPVFAWNHRWAMAKGLEGLKRELARSDPTAA
jgi:Polyketide cyclase / dehydrase and lipid transport